MKKFLLIAALLLVALGALALPAAAQTETDITTLASYFPADAPLFVSFRTDDATIQALDDLLAQIGSKIPGGLPTSVEDMLDQSVGSMQPGATFAKTIRPWLGDTAAVGLYSLDMQGNSPVTIALSITDKLKAEAFFKSQPNASDYTASQGDGFTLYASDYSYQPDIVFRDDVLLISADKELMATGGVPDSALSDNPDFGAAVEMLPADQYSAVVYADTPTIMNLYMQSANRGDQQAMGMFTSLLSAVKPQAFGLTVLDERSITIDFAAPINSDATAPFTIVEAHHPIDMSFVKHIPAGTPFVLLGTNLWDSYQAWVDNLRAVAEMMPETNNNRDFTPENLELALRGVRFFVRGLTGEELEDVGSWMNGSYAFYIGLSPAFADAQDISDVSKALPIDFAFTIEAPDPAKAERLIDGLSLLFDKFPRPEMTVHHEIINDNTDALVFTVYSDDLPFPVELLAATNNGVFAFGTRRMVTAAINPDNVGLDTDTSFTEASEYLLDDANSVLYFGSEGLQPLVRLMSTDDNATFLRMRGAQLGLFLDLVSSMSLSTSVQPDANGSISRFVWTLPE